MKNRNRSESFRNAIKGIWTTVKNERNFRIQIFAGIVAVIGCIIFRVDGWQFMMVAAAIFLVLSAELINTAIEALTDLSCNGEISALAKTAKDAAAGAVLLASVFAVIVAIVVVVSIIKGMLA
jgi:diacylglycerol kinase